MECKKCGKTIADESVYCMFCGERADGKIVCGRCGKAVDGNAVYCPYCGKRLDGKTVCPDCGEVLDGESVYCLRCGRKLAGGGERNAKTRSAKTGFGKVERVLSPALLLGALFTLFICSFFVGVTITIGAGASAVSDGATAFYFFGDAYSDLSSLLGSELAVVSDTDLSAGLYLPTVICTVFAAAGITVSSVTLVIGAVKFGTSLYNKREIKGLETLAALSLGGFLLPVAAILSYGSASASMSASSTGISVRVSPNAGALTGLIIAAFLLVGTVTLKCVAQGKNALRGGGIARLVCGAAAIILIAAALSVLGKNFLSAKRVISTSSTGSVERAKASFSASSFLFFATLVYAGTDVAIEQAGTLFTRAVISYVAFVLLAVLLIATLSLAVRSLLGGKRCKNARLALFSLSAVFSVIYLVLAAITRGGLIAYANKIDTSTTVKIGVGGCVAVLVLCVLAVAAVVTEVVLHAASVDKSDGNEIGGNGESGGVAENNA